jgi:hypothetical protein
MGNKPHKETNKRELYRITYPVNDRPILKLQGNEFEVINISEKGIKFICKQCSEFKIDVAVQCTVTFRDNTSFLLEGKISQTYKHAVVICLTGSIPLGRIIQEQRYILANYPDKFNE